MHIASLASLYVDVVYMIGYIDCIKNNCDRPEDSKALDSSYKSWNFEMIVEKSEFYDNWLNGYNSAKMFKNSITPLTDCNTGEPLRLGDMVANKSALSSNNRYKGILVWDSYTKRYAIKDIKCGGTSKNLQGLHKIDSIEGKNYIDNTRTECWTYNHKKND